MRGNDPMTWDETVWVLGSRSPRRLELLRSVVPRATVVVCTPRSSEEAGFDGLTTDAAIEQRLQEITRAKSDDVRDQLLRSKGGEGTTDSRSWRLVTADTTVVVGDGNGERLVLGQPPDHENWDSTVRDWFRRHYFGRTHRVSTAVRLVTANGQSAERVVSTEVAFRNDGERWLEWYLSTGESRGKAGGYAIQGAGSVFVAQVTGSLSNVVGLPLRELMEMTEELD